MNIYFASPLFSEMERDYNEKVAAAIRADYPDVNLYLPQENPAINDKMNFADSLLIANADNDHLLSSDLVIAVLDGVSIDVGVATEIGVAFGKNIPVIGLYTDSRQGFTVTDDKVAILKDKVAENQFHYVNLYTVGIIKLNGTITTSIKELLTTLKDYYK